MENEYDLEVYACVKRLNQIAERVVSMVIEDAEQAFAQIDSLLPRVGRKSEVDWSRAVISSGPTTSAAESYGDQRSRIENDFRSFLECAKLTDLGWITFLSDDFYSKGIECETRFGVAILDEWLQLPHGIFILANNCRALHIVSFTRTSYVFVRNDVARSDSETITIWQGPSGDTAKHRQ